MYSALNHKVDVNYLPSSAIDKERDGMCLNATITRNEETKWLEGAELKSSKLLALRSFVFRHQRIACQRVASCILRARYAEFWAGRSVCRVV